MIERTIAAANRPAFLSDFSRLHSGALATLRVGGREVIIDRPFRGFSRDRDGVIVHIGDGVHDLHSAHPVPHVVDVRLRQTNEGFDAAVAMTSRDGTRTQLQLASPVHADLYDRDVE